MNETDLEFAQEYLEKLTNTRRLIAAMKKDPNAPIDATLPLEGQLKAIQQQHMPRIIEILLREAVERELAGLPTAETQAVLNEL